ncbi:MAG: patatin-like phospholipase family protein, partial [Candidatus Promineifilaceae bacterium]|nr:patatin-like phospholipase family protein [Candidatus Promineifilaceae bacterium]
TLLDRLEQRVPGWLEQVDLLAGTSCGGAIAVGLAMGLSPAAIGTKLYRISPDLFREPPRLKAWRRTRLLRPAHDIDRLDRILDGLLGDTHLNELPRRVLLTAFDLGDGRGRADGRDSGRYSDRCGGQGTGRSWAPRIFHNLGQGRNGSRLKASKATLYTCASPTLFATCDGYIDGGAIAQNPALVALSHVLDRELMGAQRPALEDIAMLSLGTGEREVSVPGRSHRWGIWQWLKVLPDLMVDGGVRLVDGQCRQLLGRNYRRLSPPLAEKFSANDWRQRERLLAIARQADLAETTAWLSEVWGAPAPPRGAMAQRQTGADGPKEIGG